MNYTTIQRLREQEAEKLRQFVFWKNKNKLRANMVAEELEAIQAELLAITSPKDRQAEYKIFFKTK